MYDRIEKNYVDDPAIKKLSYFSTIVLLILLIILITLMLLKFAWLPSFIIAVIFLCFSVPIYYLLIIRPFFRVKERKNKKKKEIIKERKHIICLLAAIYFSLNFISRGVP